jgi:hypothetical protein
MATADIEAPKASPGLVCRSWEKVATVIAVIGLIDLSGQLIKWAALIHWIAEHYAAVRTWLFGWLPWHIPPEWHDPIVLFLILFSVTNVGLYRRKRYTIVLYFRNNWVWFAIPTLIVIIPISVALSIIKETASAPSAYWEPIKNLIYSYICWYIGWSVLAFPITCIALVFAASVIAWRWVLTTAAIFGALVDINYVYVQWLEPLAEHH